MTGALAYVMGPSGSGKDTLLAQARAALAGDGFAFAHRYITRPPFVGDENFVSLSESEFAARRAAGLFAFEWRARDVAYGIGQEIQLWRAAGLTVVVSGSRADFLTGAPTRAAAIPVLIDAARDVIAARLASRGRESAAQISARMARADDFDIGSPDLIRIDNSGLLASAVQAFIGALRSIRARSVEAV